MLSAKYVRLSDIAIDVALGSATVKITAIVSRFGQKSGNVIAVTLLTRPGSVEPIDRFDHGSCKDRATWPVPAWNMTLVIANLPFAFFTNCPGLA
jgi:hypothetical protein